MNGELTGSDPAAFVDSVRKFYSTGGRDVENSIDSYDRYLRSMGPGLSLDGLITGVLKHHTPCRLLDLGCGNAGMLAGLVKKYGSRIEAHGLDLVPPAVVPRGVRFRGGDAAAAALPEDCDIILSFRALHEIGRVDDVLFRIAPALGPGGRAFLSFRIAELNAQGQIEFQGCMTAAALERLRVHGKAGMMNGVRLSHTEVTGVMPGASAPVFVRGINLFMEH